MQNKRAEQLLTECSEDLDRIEQIIIALGPTNNAVPYLTKYLIIKICGTFEQSFKTIISDFATLSQNLQVKKFIDINFRESSMNPNLSNIYKSLKQFDETWHNALKHKIKLDPDKSRIEDSIKSLNNARNEFAHGGNPKTTLKELQIYFVDVIKIVEYIDGSVF